MSDENAAALYFDGQTAIAWPASCKLAGNTGLLISTTGSGLKLWPIGELFLASPPARDAALSLGCRTLPNERLVVRDQVIAKQIEAAAPGLRRALDKFRPWQWWQWIAGVSAAAFGVALIATALDAAPEVLTPLVPYELEAAIGVRVIDGLGAMIGRTCTNRDAVAPLEKLAKRLADAAGWDRPLTIHVVASPTPNAFAVPGGHIVIFSGLIEKAGSGDEVAGVFAHEVGHAVRRHSMRGVIRDLGLSVVATLVTGGATGDVSAAVSGYGNKLLLLSYGRAAEREADDFALTMLERIGVRGGGLADFFIKRQEEEKHRSGIAPEWLSTHPPTPERIDALKRAKPGGSPAFTADEWAELKKVCGSRAPQRTPK